MDFKTLVGCRFQETALFDQIQFEVESNLVRYLIQDRHIFFERSTEGTVLVTEVVEYLDDKSLHNVNKASFGIKEWISVMANRVDASVQLCRLDQSGRLALVEKDHTHIQETGICYADPNAPRMTEDEIRQAVRELCGIFDQHQESQKLKTKVSV